MKGGHTSKEIDTQRERERQLCRIALKLMANAQYAHKMVR